MKEYSKVIYGKRITTRNSDNTLLIDLYIDDKWVNTSNSLDNIRGELFEVLLNRLYEISLGKTVLKHEIIECYYKSELFTACFKQLLED